MKTLLRTMYSLAVLVALVIALPMYAAPIEGSGTITFGKTSANCTGFGICKMASDKSSSIQGEMKCTFKYDEAQRTFTIIVNQLEVNTKNPAMMQYFANKNSVSIDEDFTIPREVTDLLKATNDITIKKGNYNLLSKDGVLEIVITF